MLKLFLAGLGFLASLCGITRGQELIGIDLILGDVFRVDAKTGLSTYVGNTGLNRFLWHSMAKDSHGRIFAGYGGFGVPYAIYEINPLSGSASLVVQTDRVDLLGLAFDPSDQLFALHERQVPGHPSDLYTIDLATGLTTLVGSTGLTDVQALAYGRGSLWGWDLNVGLVRIDALTGTATDVNSCINDGTGLIQTLAFSDDGILYGGLYALFVVDSTTGALSYVNSYLPSIPFLAGMEFLPNQPPPFSLGVSGETGGPMGAFVAGATPGGNVAFFATTGYGGPTRILPGHACGGTFLDLNSHLRLLEVTQADAAGQAEIGPVQVPWYPTGVLRLQALDVATCATSNRARVVY